MSEQGTGPWETQRLVIRKGHTSDADEIWPWREDEELNEWLTVIPTSPEQNKERWVAGLDTTYVAEMAGTIVATGKIVPEQAWAQAEVADRTDGAQAEIGWVVAPDHQGLGIGTEFAKALLDVAFASGVRRVTAYCFADNAASARIMEKIGMHREAHFRADSLHRSGQWHDSYVYAILDSDPR